MQIFRLSILYSIYINIILKYKIFALSRFIRAHKKGNNINRPSSQKTIQTF